MGLSGSKSPSPPPPPVQERVVVKVVEKVVEKKVDVFVDVSEENQKILQGKLGDLKEEVKSVAPLIQDGVIDTTHTIEDAIVMRYSQLEDKLKIKQNIQEVLKATDFPGTQLIVDAAYAMINALNSTTEMKDIGRWYQRKTLKRWNDKVVGIECHYKVNIMEKDVSSGIFSKAGIIQGKKETICLVAYKFLAHIVNKEPEDYMDDAEAEQCLKF